MSDHTPDPVIGDAPPQANTLLSNNVYDKLKQVAQIWLPALAVFYITIAPLWNLPRQEEVAGTIMALDLLLGAGLGVLASQYRKSDARFDGEFTISPHEEEGYDQLRVHVDEAAVLNKDEVTIKVNRPQV